MTSFSIVSQTLFVLILGTVISSVAWAQKNFLDSIVVVVGDEVITESELKTYMRTTVRDLKRSKKPIPQNSVLARQSAEALIQEKLLQAEAERRGLTSSEAEIDGAVGRIAKQNKISLEQLTQALEKDGMTMEAYRQLLGRQMVMQTVVERMMGQQVRVSDAEVNLYLTAQKSRGSADQEVELARIVVGVKSDASSAEASAALDKGNKIVSALNAGKDFAKLAQEFSDAPEAISGGDVGWRKPGQLPSIYLDAIAKLEAGEHSDVIQTPNGIHILKIQSRRATTTKTVEQMSIRQIVMRPTDVLDDEEIIKRLGALRERILAGDDFATLARAHSEDTTSRAVGGDLGWILPEELPPSIRDVLTVLTPGETTDPVRTAAGFHLFQLVDRKERSIDEELRRKQARQAIIERKRDEFFQRWTRQLRDEAFVEYRVEL